MPTMNRGCSWQGCPGLAKEGARYCGAHLAEARKARDAAKGERAKHYKTAHWQRLRMVVLRQEPLCRECKDMGRLTPATVVDHIKPLSDGGTDAMTNLQPLCKECHDLKTNRESAARTNRRRAERG